MAKKIDFILPLGERYNKGTMVSQWVAEGMRENGIAARFLSPPADKSKPQKFLEDLIHVPPACTFCVNGILPDKEGNFLADMLQIPHIAYVIESPTLYYNLCNSDYTIVGTVDSEFYTIFSELKGQNVFFLPGAAPHYTAPVPPVGERSGHVLMVPSLIDLHQIVDEWNRNLPKKMVQFLIDSADTVLRSSKETCTSSFLKGWDVFSLKEKEELSPYRTLNLIQELEFYIRGLDQLEILRALQQVPVKLIVNPGTVPEWQKQLKDVHAKVTFTESSDFDTIFAAIQESKIFVNSAPHIKNGTDGWPLLALLGGCYLFSSRNNWLEKRYSQEEGCYFYNYTDRSTIHEKATDLLHNAQEMGQAVAVGRKKVLQEDTWKSRAKQLLDLLPPYLTPLTAKGRFYKKSNYS